MCVCVCVGVGGRVCVGMCVCVCVCVWACVKQAKYRLCSNYMSRKKIIIFLETMCTKKLFYMVVGVLVFQVSFCF